MIQKQAQKHVLSLFSAKSVVANANSARFHPIMGEKERIPYRIGVFSLKNFTSQSQKGLWDRVTAYPRELPGLPDDRPDARWELPRTNTIENYPPDSYLSEQRFTASFMEDHVSEFLYIIHHPD